MAISITCDTCRQSIPRGAGWKVRALSDRPAESGDPQGEYCSTICLGQAANRHRGRRPDFAGARMRLQGEVDSIIEGLG